MIKRPEDVYTEHAIIRTAFVDPELFPLVREHLDTGMFSSEANRMVFSALIKMQEDGVTLDQVALRGYLDTNYERIGGDSYLDTINGIEVLPSNIHEYIKIVKDTYIRRATIDAGLDIAESGMHGASAEVGVNKLLTYSDSLAGEMAGGSTILSISDLIDTELEAFHGRVKDPGFRGIRTGIESYDQIIGGLGRGDQILIAGRPGSGKTSLLLSVLFNQASFGIPVALFSYEMGPAQILKRLVSMHSGVSHIKIDTGRVSSNEKDRVEASFTRVNGLPFYLTYSTAMSVDEVANVTTKLVRVYGVEVAALDYIQLMTTNESNINNELGRVSRILKLSAQKNAIPWLVACQLNRKVEYRENKRPILSDLRDSGNLEQDADLVIMLYRDEMYNQNSLDNGGLADLLVRKNRHGPLAELTTRFEKEIMKFSALDSL